MQLLDLGVDGDLHERVEIAREVGRALLEQLVEAVNDSLVLDDGSNHPGRRYSWWAVVKENSIGQGNKESDHEI